MDSMTTLERVGFEASVAMEKDLAIVRGWTVGNDAEVKAKIKAYNEREYERCKNAALALLDL